MTLKECITNLEKEIRCRDRLSNDDCDVEDCQKCVYFVHRDTFDESLRYLIGYGKMIGEEE